MSYTRLKKRHLIRHNINRIKSSEYFRVLVLRTIGNFLIISSLFMIGKTFYQPAKEEIRYFFDNVIQKKYIILENKNSRPKADQSLVKKGLLAKALNLKTVDFLIPEDPNFSIIIPKIGANAKIISNVDASDENIYLTALKTGVAQAMGTAYPGEKGHIFLFAHSTDYFWNVGTYNAVFYLLYKLQKNDEINLFYQGHRYKYKVFDKKIINPNEVEYLTRKTDKELLTLQTCWPPGTTLQRLLVFAERVAN